LVGYKISIYIIKTVGSVKTKPMLSLSRSSDMRNTCNIELQY